jgi:hypothetical protein
MDQMVNAAPAPMSASVILPRVLLKKEPGELGVSAGGCCWRAAALAGTSSWRLAGDRRVSFDVFTLFTPACAASSLAAQGAAAAPNATVTHKAQAAARLLSDVTCVPPLIAL